MRSIEDDVAYLLQESIYIPCTLELCVPLWTYDAVQAEPRYNGLRRHIGAREIMHDAMTSIRPIKCMANTNKSIYNTMASLGSS